MTKKYKLSEFVTRKSSAEQKANYCSAFTSGDEKET